MAQLKKNIGQAETRACKFHEMQLLKNILFRGHKTDRIRLNHSE